MMPGNSGGPALDREGRAIGLATFGTGFQQRIGGIVAMSAARPVAQGPWCPTDCDCANCA
jgi:S1-C subfamily serine protease